ncbi:MAG: IS110 family transposase [Gammaproteobacteria bacterium]|nr:IS110 family transposase [Gammaproteobacteria bacterium]
MSKRRYHATQFNMVNWAAIAEHSAGQGIVFAVDVAKEDFVGTLMSADRIQIKTLKWTHPQQTQALVAHVVNTFDPACLEVAMEPSGTYGDALRRLLVNAGVSVFRISPKRVHDAAELYDGVPSLHDAKAAYLIARLHLDGVSQPWHEPSEQRRSLSAQLGLLEMYRERHQRSLSRLEALLSRHWPEVIRQIDVGSATLLKLIATYGDAKSVVSHAEEAEGPMRRTGRVGLRQEKIEQVLESARHTVGVPCIEVERHVLQVLAQDMVDTREALRQVEKALESQVEADPTLERMAAVVGKTTSAVLLSCQETPQAFADANSYLKSLGLNLKERSSGKHKGQLKITKRGPGVARRYLYFAALRWIQRDAGIQQWYQRKVARDGGLKSKAIIAVMRKLTKALWHVARGECFDASKLFNNKALTMAA